MSASNIPPIPTDLQRFEHLYNPQHPLYLTREQRQTPPNTREYKIAQLNYYTQQIHNQWNEIRSEETYLKIQSLNPENNLLLRTCCKIAYVVGKYFKMAGAAIKERSKLFNENRYYPALSSEEYILDFQYQTALDQYYYNQRTSAETPLIDSDIDADKKILLNVYPSKIQSSPEEVVMDICTCLTNSGSLPIINLTGSAGIDAGGVRRSVLSEASQNMLTKTTSRYYTCQINPDTKAFMIYPHAKPSSENPLESPPNGLSSLFFIDLGALFYSCHINKQFSLSLNIDSTILKAAVTLFNEFSQEITTQQTFPPQLLKLLPPQALLKLYAIFTNNEHMLQAITTYTETGESSYLQDSSGMDQEKFKTSSQKEVFTQTLSEVQDYFNPTLYQKIEGAILTAIGMMKNCKKQGNNKPVIDPTSFEMSIRGDFKIEDLKSKIRRDLGASDTTTKLETWIDEQATNPSPLLSQWIKDKGYPDNISNVHMFLMALTGSFSLLPTDRAFEIMSNPGHSYFKFHTCYSQLDVPHQDKIKDQKDFNRVLEESIIIAMGSEGGFQFG